MRNEPTHRIRSTFRTRGIALWDRRRSAFGSFDGDPSSSCAAWLRGLGLGQCESAFRANDVDAQVLPRLTAEDLISIGVNSVGHRRRLLDAIVALGAEAPPATVPIPAVAERRQLTVMFCDMVGSTALSARLDPENYREVIAAYHRAVAKIIAESDGFVSTSSLARIRLAITRSWIRASKLLIFHPLRPGWGVSGSLCKRSRISSF